MRQVASTTLSKEARDAILLAQTEGTFPYPKDDGKLFRNRESKLPVQGTDYYREYTVVTPGCVNRGSQRIVIGKGGEIYFTFDHYSTFMEVV